MTVVESQLTYDPEDVSMTLRCCANISHEWQGWREGIRREKDKMRDVTPVGSLIV